MKILSSDQLRKADSYTIKNEPISSIDLMERAATCCFNWIIQNFKPDKSIGIIAGSGNNGGDGLVISRLLIQSGYRVNTYIVWLSEKGSADFTINLQRLKDLKANLIEIKNSNEVNPFDEDLLIDAVFGTGLSRVVTGVAQQAIDAINNSNKQVVSIDLPSGMYANQPMDDKKNIVIANYTLTFQSPKLSFLLPGYGDFAGYWEVLDIGLHPKFINELPSHLYLIEKRDISQIKRIRPKFTHKGSFGHALLIAGSKGMMGAAVLSGRGCIKSGVGLLTIGSPKIGYEIIQTAVPEALFKPLDEETLKGLEHCSAIGIGPGLGKSKEVQSLLKILIQNIGCPLVFDADAINILGENKTWIAFLPKNSILTPHLKEFERITHTARDSYERLEIQRDFSIKNGVYVILKGAHSSISCPNGDIFFNNTGNSGMATAGSGDVLTGIIVGLLAQGYHPKQASVLGVYLHGLAGDLAKEEEGEEALTAQSIIDNMGKAFLSIN